MGQSKQLLRFKCLFIHSQKFLIFINYVINYNNEEEEGKPLILSEFN